MTDAEAIACRLGASLRAQLDPIEVFPELPSTNSYLLQQKAPEPGRFRAALAEHQTAGRGRNGKTWIAAPCSSLCLSLACTFKKTPDNLASLTLAIGAGVAEVLMRLGASDIALKWPNDLIARGGKLGGILIETHAGGAGVVIGLGLNVNLPKDLRESLASSGTDRAADLAECMDAAPGMNDLAATMIECVATTVSRYEREGLEAFRASWQRVDWLRGKVVETGETNRRVRGTAEGIDGDGALLVRTDGGLMRIVSGSVAVADSAAACA
ncbi:MAG: biotin--[acetyl-CoA-carboxylase] ligase [Woeseia sp.]